MEILRWKALRISARGSKAAQTPQFVGDLTAGVHPFPSRTRKLSPAGPMVLHAKVCGRVGRCRHKIKASHGNMIGLFLLNLSVPRGPHPPHRRLLTLSPADTLYPRLKSGFKDSTMDNLLAYGPTDQRTNPAFARFWQDLFRPLVEASRGTTR